MKQKWDKGFDCGTEVEISCALSNYCIIMS